MSVIAPCLTHLKGERLTMVRTQSPHQNVVSTSDPQATFILYHCARWFVSCNKKLGVLLQGLDLIWKISVWSWQIKNVVDEKINSRFLCVLCSKFQWQLHVWSQKRPQIKPLLVSTHVPNQKQNNQQTAGVFRKRQDTFTHKISVSLTNCDQRHVIMSVWLVPIADFMVILKPSAFSNQ